MTGRAAYGFAFVVALAGALVVGAAASCVQLVETSGWSSAGTLDVGGRLYSIAFSPDSSLVAVGASDRIGLYDITAGTVVRAFVPPPAPPVDHKNAPLVTRVYPYIPLAFSPDGKLLASGGRRSDYAVMLWDVASGALLRELLGHVSGISSVAFSPNGKMLASGSGDGRAKLWDMATGSLQRTLRGQKGGIDSVAFSPDGSLVATGSYDGTAVLWDTATGAVLHTLDAGRLVKIGQRPVVFSPDGVLLATWSRDKTAQLWDVATGQLRRTFIGNAGTADCLAFSPDGRTLASASGYTIELWDVALGDVLRVLTWFTEPIVCIAFSPDGRFLACGSAY